MSEQWMAKLQDIACGEESILQISMRKLTRPKDDIHGSRPPLTNYSMTSVSPVPSTAQTRHARASYLKEEEARRKSRVAEIEAAGKADVARIKATGKVLQDLAKLEPEQAEHLRWLTGWTTLVFFAD